jgi:hypothetical protein
VDIPQLGSEKVKWLLGWVTHAATLLLENLWPVANVIKLF